jgi:chromosome segregation ATPase
MPDTLKSLKVENDELKRHVNQLKGDFKNLQDTMLKKIQDLSIESKAVASQSQPTNTEMSKSLDYLGNEYDDRRRFRTFAEKEFGTFNKRLEELANRSNKIANAIDEIQKYSYQYNLKIIGVPEQNQDGETAEVTTNICIRLFEKLGVKFDSHDIDIAH